MKHAKRNRAIVAALMSLLIVAMQVPTLAGAAPNVVLGLEAGEYTSCPYLYVFDGNSYALDNDLISVGRGPASEYVDYLGLSVAPKATDGRLKFRVEEPEGEKSYLDRLGIAGIIHPPGTKVGVDDKGAAHSYADPSSPSAADASGSDAKAAVSAADGEGKLLYDGESLTVDFAVADLAAGGKLVVRADGFELDEQREDSVDPKVPAILIQTQENGDWVTRATYHPKGQAAMGVYDLKEWLDASAPKVRLVSVSCRTSVAHKVDYVALDTTADQVTQSALDLVSAKKGDADMSAQLSASDNSYAEMGAGEAMDLEFQAPSVPDGQLVDYVAVSEGYYDTTGNTFFIQTRDAIGTFVNRVSSLYTSDGRDYKREFDLSALANSYFPEGDTYKVRVRNIMQWRPAQWARIDNVYLKVDGVNYKLTSAVRQGDNADVLDALKSSDDVRTDAMNKMFILTFEPPNQAPEFTLGSSAVTVDEGSKATNSGTWSDPDGDTVQMNASLGSVVLPGAGGASAWDWAWSAVDGPKESQTVTITASDGQTTTVKPFDLTVRNVAPDAGNIVVPLAPTPVNNSVVTSVSFTDPGVQDTHSVVWDWGDGSTSDGNVSELDGSGGATGSHTYSQPGVYPVSAKVTDKDGDSDQVTSSNFIVVYDPSGGFVTGGGWIQSPAGAYPQASTAEGKATFGFVSKYLKGASTPSGNTEFQFQAGDLKFKSTSYDWLVVAGARAQYQGTGTITGRDGNFAFQLTAVDGQVTGGGGTDRFRMKIIDKQNDTVVYDNMLGTGDSVAPTVIGGGSIVVHK